MFEKRNINAYDTDKNNTVGKKRKRYGGVMREMEVCEDRFGDIYRDIDIDIDTDMHIYIHLHINVRGMKA